MPHTATLQTAPHSRVQLERFPAAADSDTATQQTISLMCRYISEAAADPEIQNAADYVRCSYAGGSAQPAELGWGVFWFLKHNLKFVVDEAPLMRFERVVPGSGWNQQDMLIRPDVLIRMQKREGDCDDFTMLCCALLKCLGVPFVIVTIACGADDPSRWSHVFPMALCPAAIPLDASHGSAPGWMVPREHTFRWQAWDQDGNQVDLKRPDTGMHGWVSSSRAGMGAYGLGQDCFDTEGNPIDCSQTIAGAAPTPPPVTETPFPIVTQAPSSTPSTSTPFSWTSFLNNLAGQAAGVAKVAEIQGATNTAALGVSSVLSSLLPIFLLVVVGGVAISMFESKR